MCGGLPVQNSRSECRKDFLRKSREAVAFFAGTVLPRAPAALSLIQDCRRSRSCPRLKRLPAASVIDGFLMSRRSVREFKQEPVTKETLETL